MDLFFSRGWTSCLDGISCKVLWSPFLLGNYHVLWRKGLDGKCRSLKRMKAYSIHYNCSEILQHHFWHKFFGFQPNTSAFKCSIFGWRVKIFYRRQTLRLKKKMLKTWFPSKISFNVMFSFIRKIGCFSVKLYMKVGSQRFRGLFCVNI